MPPTFIQHLLSKCHLNVGRQKKILETHRSKASKINITPNQHLVMQFVTRKLVTRTRPRRSEQNMMCARFNSTNVGQTVQTALMGPKVFEKNGNVGAILDYTLSKFKFVSTRSK